MVSHRLRECMTQHLVSLPVSPTLVSPRHAAPFERTLAPIDLLSPSELQARCSQVASLATNCWPPSPFKQGMIPNAQSPALLSRHYRYLAFGTGSLSARSDTFANNTHYQPANFNLENLSIRDSFRVTSLSTELFLSMTQVAGTSTLLTMN